MINAIAPARTAPIPSTATAPAAAAAAVAPARLLDTEKVGFRLHIEVVDVDPSRLNRSLSKHGWTAHNQSDCSHGYNDSHRAYVMLNSPVMHAGSAAWKTIHEVLGEARNAGAQLGSSGAMKILVENKSLDLETYKGLMRLQMACEPIIYKAARNGKQEHVGESGWNSPAAPQRQKGGYYFCTPPSANPVSAKSLTATTVQQMQQILAGGGSYVARHYGFQPFSVTANGFSEFRYFTGTTDADNVCADVQMVLGMVKCAHEGRWPADTPAHPLSDPKPVDFKTYSLFTKQVLGDAADRIDSLFKAAGGTVSQPPLDTPELREHKMRLEQAGWRFEPPNLAEITADTKVAVTEPGQRKPYHLTHEDLPSLLRIENGSGTPQNAALLGRLRDVGVQFFAADSTVPLTSRSGPAIMLAQGHLEAGLDGTRVPVLSDKALTRYAVDTFVGRMMAAGWRFESEGPLSLGALTERLGQGHGVDVRPPQGDAAYALRADQVSTLACAEGGLLELLQPTEQAALAGAQQLAQRGIRFEDSERRPIDAALASVMSVDSGRVQARQGDETVPFDPATRELLNDASKALPADLSATLQALPGAEARLVDAQGAPAAWDVRIAWLHQKGELFAERAGEKEQVDTAATVRDRVLRPHLAANLDAGQRERLSRVQRLEDAGFEVLADNGTRLQPSSLEWLQTVSASQGPLTLRAPESKVCYPMTATGLDNLYRKVGGEAIDADLQDALQKADALRAAGCTILSDIDTLMGLTAGREVQWTDPLGRVHKAASTGAFRATAGPQLDGIHMSDGQRAALDSLGGMMQKAQVTLRMPSQAVVTQANQVPWLIGSHTSIDVRARAEENVADGSRPGVVRLEGWNAGERFVEVERDPSIAGTSGALLAHMRAIGAQVYPVTAWGRARKAAVPITLNSAALQTLDQAGLRLKLPSWTFWKGWPRRNVVVRGGDELARLAKKFA